MADLLPVDTRVTWRRWVGSAAGYRTVAGTVVDHRGKYTVVSDDTGLRVDVRHERLTVAEQ